MDLTTVILNINKGHNEQLMKTCRILKEYTELVSRIRYYQKDMSLETAVTCAVDECISEGILAEFLSKNRREAIRVSVLECKFEDVVKVLQEEAKEDGYEEGRAEGEAAGKIKNQLSSIQSIMKNLNLNPSQSMDALNIPDQERDVLMKQLDL